MTRKIRTGGRTEAPEKNHALQLPARLLRDALATFDDPDAKQESDEYGLNVAISNAFILRAPDLTEATLPDAFVIASEMPVGPLRDSALAALVERATALRDARATKAKAQGDKDGKTSYNGAMALLNNYQETHLLPDHPLRLEHRNASSCTHRL